MRFGGRLFHCLRYPHLTLDLDSAVINRRGPQSAASRDYNRKRMPRASHHSSSSLSRTGAWWTLEAGLEIADFDYQAQGHPRMTGQQRENAKVTSGGSQTRTA